MIWRSVRLRLTLWHVLVLGLVLVGFGVALSYSLRASLAGAVDATLADRAHGLAERWSRGGEFPAPSPRPFAHPDQPIGPEDPGAVPPTEGTPSNSPTPASEAERRSFFRKPRILDLEGHPMVPFSGDQPWDEVTFRGSAVKGVELYSTIMLDTDRVRVFSIPLWGPEGVEGVVQVAHPLTEQDRLNAGLTKTLLTLIPIALLVAGLGGIFLSGRALRPVRRITQTAARISAADLSQRLEVTGKDELAELATTFNGMIDRLQEAFDRLESAYEQQRRFTGDASHELRTPLTAIKANTSFALCGERTPEDYREALQAADEAADTMTRIVQDLLLLARSDGGQLALDTRPVELEPVLRRAASSLRDRTSTPVLVELPAERLAVTGDEHHLTRLFLNLLENAARHTPPEGRIILRARAEGESVVVQVVDTGEGISPEHLPHVCERFYRVDSARSREQGGTGLGLPICQSIVQAHGGNLVIESEVGRGTTVTVTLPAAAPQPSPVPELVATR